jgi:hypothetical protein
MRGFFSKCNFHNISPEKRKEKSSHFRGGLRWVFLKNRISDIGHLTLNNKKNRNLKIPQGSDPRWHNRKDIPSQSLLKGEVRKPPLLSPPERRGNFCTSALFKDISRCTRRISLCTKRISVCMKRISVCARRISLCVKRISVCARRISLCVKRVPACGEQISVCAKRISVCARRLSVCAERIPVCTKRISLCRNKIPV